MSCRSLLPGSDMRFELVQTVKVVLTTLLRYLRAIFERIALCVFASTDDVRASCGSKPCHRLVVVLYIVAVLN